jgi:hypothetical protein
MLSFTNSTHKASGPQGVIKTFDFQRSEAVLIRPCIKSATVARTIGAAFVFPQLKNSCLIKRLALQVSLPSGGMAIAPGHRASEE